VKAELLNRRLGLSASGFEIRQTNVAEADGRGFYQQIAEGKSRGLELEVVGNPLAGLVIIGGYTWLRTEVLRDLAGFTGNALPNAPDHQGNLWVRYRFTEGLLHPLSLGAGIVHVSSRFTSAANTVTVPGYTRIDSTVSYGFANRRLGLVVACQNLTNERYVTSGAGRVFYAGAPRRLSVTLTTAF
jgi:iron complex outermembrane recepter protein